MRLILQESLGFGPYPKAKQRFRRYDSQKLAVLFQNDEATLDLQATSWLLVCRA